MRTQANFPLPSIAFYRRNCVGCGRNNGWELSNADKCNCPYACECADCITYKAVRFPPGNDTRVQMLRHNYICTLITQLEEIAGCSPDWMGSGDDGV